MQNYNQQQGGGPTTAAIVFMVIFAVLTVVFLFLSVGGTGEFYKLCSASSAILILMTYGIDAMVNRE